RPSIRQRQKEGTGTALVGTSSLRVAIVVAAIVLGAVGLAKAVPIDASRHIVPAGAGGSPKKSSPSPSPPKTVSPPKSLTRGVTVQLLNGSGKIGLAGDTRTTIKSAHLGYRLLAPGDAARTATTAIYHTPSFLAAARHLRE